MQDNKRKHKPCWCDGCKKYEAVLLNNRVRDTTRTNAIWSQIENCRHEKTVTRVIPASLDDRGNWVDSLRVKRCAIKPCNKALGWS